MNDMLKFIKSGKTAKEYFKESEEKIEEGFPRSYREAEKLEKELNKKIGDISEYIYSFYNMIGENTLGTLKVDQDVSRKVDDYFPKAEKAIKSMEKATNRFVDVMEKEMSIITEMNKHWDDEDLPGVDRAWYPNEYDR
jgi:type I site-specific restriction endonuclease